MSVLAPVPLICIYLHRYFELFSFLKRHYSSRFYFSFRILSSTRVSARQMIRYDRVPSVSLFQFSFYSL